MDDIPLNRPFTMEDLEKLRERCIREGKQRRGEYMPLPERPSPEPALPWAQKLCRKFCGCQPKLEELPPLPKVEPIIFSIEEINGFYRLALAQLRGEAPWPNRPLKYSLKAPMT